MITNLAEVLKRQYPGKGFVLYTDASSIPSTICSPQVPLFALDSRYDPQRLLGCKSVMQKKQRSLF